MKKLIFTLTFTIGITILMVKGQEAPKKPDPMAPPTQTDQAPDAIEQDAEDIEFPADVVDPTIDDTSEIPNVKIDSSENIENRDTIGNNWDNSGLKKEEETNSNE